MFEKIAYAQRFFVPTGPEGVKVLERLTKARPITGVMDADGQPVTLSQSLSISPQVRDQVLIDLRREMNRLFPLSSFGG